MHAMSPAPSAPPSPSRLRRRVATLVLVAACLGTVATSQPRSQSVTSTVSSTTRLTQDTPTSTHRFVVQVSARNSSELAQGEVRGQLTARWKPAGFTASPPIALRSRLARVDDTEEPSSPLPLDTPDSPEKESLRAAYFECKLDTECELEVELSLEAQGKLGEGIVEVEWRVDAEAYTNTDDAPERFAVEIQER